jgi:2'-5' RNA ligase
VLIAMQAGAEFKFRAFVGVHPPPALVESLSVAVRQWMRRIGTQGVKWVSPQNYHLTLEFLGNVGASSAEALGDLLAEACRNLAPVELKVQGGGCFPDVLRPKVFFVKLQGSTEELLRLQGSVAEASRGFGEPRDGKPFEPHLTVARFDWLNREQLLHVKRICENPMETDLGSWRIDSVNLFRSESELGGARYQVLRSVRLEG